LTVNNNDLESKMIEVFGEEANEQVNEIDKNILLLEFLKDQNKDEYLENIKETMTSIYSVMHTLKASTGSLGYNNISTFLHNIETFLYDIKNGSIDINSDLISGLIDVSACIKKDITFVIENKKDVDGTDYTEIYEMIEKHKSGVSIAEKYFQIILNFNPEILKTGTDPLMLLRELSKSGEIIENKPNEKEVPLPENLTPDELYITWELVYKTTLNKDQIEEIFSFVKHTSEIIIEDISERYKEDNQNKLISEKKLGEILIDKGKVDETSVKEALGEQKPIGEILVEKGNVSQEDVNDALNKQQKAKKSVSSTSVRVNINKLDTLVNQIGELVISHSRIMDLAEKIPQTELQRTLISSIDDSSRIIREIQEGIMSTRMIAIDSTFSQFYRVVRDLSLKQNKIIRLVLTGQETELDKNVIEKINNPLKHMIRNAIDHGIETTEERIQQGKTKEATIHLKAYHKDGNVVIEISDDGKGLDRESIYKKALANGLIKEDEDVSDEYLYNQIFNAGFSTAANITDISGRGVGMDIVKKAIQELRGRIEMKSEKGKGTSFIIKLPLTLAIIDGLIITIGNRLFILPLLSVENVFKPVRSQIKTLESSGEYIDIKGECFSLVRLHHLFNIDSAITEPENAIMLNINQAGKLYSLMADDIIGQKQIVIKSLEENYSKIIGFSGATILGDGNVAMIIEPNEIISIYREFNPFITNVQKENMIQEVDKIEREEY
jgi:two-component system chemotaxis sensor kinase CheA